jgi:hypothetical protein
MKVIFSFKNDPGIGDNYRGLISLLQIQKKIKHLKSASIYVNFSYSLIGNFLVNKLPAELSEVAKSKEIKYFMYANEYLNDDEIINYILNSNEDIIHINTNNYPDITNISDDIKHYIKNIFEFSPEFLEIFNKYFDYLGSDFDIFHCRFGDDIFYNDYIHGEKYNALIEKLQQNINANCLILSDSFNFKKELYKTYNNNVISVFLHKPSHTNNTHNNEALNIFIDFFIITKAKHIYCWGVYTFISNFVLWHSYIYDIPLTKIEVR